MSEEKKRKADGGAPYPSSVLKKPRCSNRKNIGVKALLQESRDYIEAERYLEALQCIENAISKIKNYKSSKSIIKILNKEKWTKILSRITQSELTNRVRTVWSKFYQLLWKKQEWARPVSYKKRIEYLQELAKYDWVIACDYIYTFCQKNEVEEKNQVSRLAERAEKLSNTEEIGKKELIPSVFILHKYSKDHKEVMDLVTNLYSEILKGRDINCIFIYLGIAWFDTIKDEDGCKMLLQNIYNDKYRISSDEKRELIIKIRTYFYDQGKQEQVDFLSKLFQSDLERDAKQWFYTALEEGSLRDAINTYKKYLSSGSNDIKLDLARQCIASSKESKSYRYGVELLCGLSRNGNKKAMEMFVQKVSDKDDVYITFLCLDIYAHNAKNVEADKLFKPSDKELKLIEQTLTRFIDDSSYNNDALYKKILLLLADLKYEGLLFVQDKEQARKYYKKGSDLEFEECYQRYASMCYLGEGGNEDLAEAEKYFLQDCAVRQHMNSESAYLLGDIYFFGANGSRDKIKAAEYYEQAAKQKHVNGLYSLIMLHEEGILIATKYLADLYINNNLDDSFHKWLREFRIPKLGEESGIYAEQLYSHLLRTKDENMKQYALSILVKIDSSEAYYQLYKYYSEHECYKNEAHKYLVKAIKHDFPSKEAEFEAEKLGFILDQKDKIRSLEILSAKGVAKAMYLLTCLVKTNKYDSTKEWTDWLRTAAEQGDPDAQYEYACYKKDTENEIYLDFLQRAAEQKHLKSLYELGTYYLKSSETKEQKDGEEILLRIAEGNNIEFTKRARDILVGYYTARDPAVATLKLMSSLYYNSHRHNYRTSSICQAYGYMIKEMLSPQIAELLHINAERFDQWDERELGDFLEKKETEDNNYFAGFLSDDSDDEQEEKYTLLNDVLRSAKVRTSNIIRYISSKFCSKLEHIENLDIDDFSKDDLKKELAKINELYGQAEPKTPNYRQKRTIINKDIQTLNKHASDPNSSLESALPLLREKYVIAHYRGINYNVKDWNQPSRRAHRKLLKRLAENEEYGDAIYCAAAYKEARVGYAAIPSPYERLKLEKYSALVRYKLMQLNQGPRIQKGNKCYKTPRDFLHTLHSNDKNQFEQLVIQSLEVGIDHFINEKTPYLAFGKMPFHPLKYAYLKAYSGHKHERLRPRWRKNLRAERPYVGAVYLTLHPLSDYIKSDWRAIVPSNFSGEMDVRLHILQEREITFYGLIKKGRLKYIHQAKYPSFNEAYRKIYLHKYGLTKEFYERLQKLFKESSPHSPKRRLAKVLLEVYLCAYYDRYLLRKSYELAQEDNSILIYHNIHGGFTLTPPTQKEVNPTPKGKESYIRARRSRTNRLRQERDKLERKADDDNAKIPVINYLKFFRNETSVDVDMLDIDDNINSDDEYNSNDTMDIS